MEFGIQMRMDSVGMAFGTPYSDARASESSNHRSERPTVPDSDSDSVYSDSVNSEIPNSPDSDSGRRHCHMADTMVVGQGPVGIHSIDSSESPLADDVTSEDPTSWRVVVVGMRIVVVEDRPYSIGIEMGNSGIGEWVPVGRIGSGDRPCFRHWNCRNSHRRFGMVRRIC